MNRFDELVEGYRTQCDKELGNAQREVMQKVALAGLSRGGFSSMLHFMVAHVSVSFIN